MRDKCKLVVTGVAVTAFLLSPMFAMKYITDSWPTLFGFRTENVMATCVIGIFIVPLAMLIRWAWNTEQDRARDNSQQDSGETEPHDM